MSIEPSRRFLPDVRFPSPQHIVDTLKQVEKAYGDKMSDQDIWNLVNYIRSKGPNGTTK